MVLRGVTLDPSGAGFTVDNPKPWDSNTISEIANKLASSEALLCEKLGG